MENTPPFSSIFDHITSHINLNQQDKELFTSVLRVRKVKRRQLLEQPGFISGHRTYVVTGAFRAYFVGTDGQEHTLSLAVDNWMIGDPGSFLLQEPATLFVEALEDSTVIQWTYESEQMLVEKIPHFSVAMMRRAQQIAVMIQRRVVSLLSLTAEERYEEFAQTYPVFVQRIPLYVIASYLGMTREFLSKIRNQRTAPKK
ncbi:Crp/Fnr family transcriptional regulator [Fibrella sp. WM1]|uniref:Crp/Fnr family transcriptional regulator n=1 Tax=Fibrella musci TaxID=3242485 RepID=UPI003520FB98